MTGVEDTSVIVLDGGLSTALEEGGADLSGHLWTARLLAEEPERILEAHRAFFASGAQVATTSTYQASVEGFVAAGLDEDTARRLLVLSIRLAQEAREGRDGLLVAASVGPYGAFLADGSEYRGDYGVSRGRLRDFHGPRLALLASAGPDLLAVETIPDLVEAEVLADLVDEAGVPAWFCYSVRGDRTCAGQPLTEAYDVLAARRSVVAAGVNCSDQSDVLHAVRTAHMTTGLPAVAYPNRGGTWDAATRSWTYGEAIDLDLVAAWVGAGARWVGGCCGLGPADIGTLASRLRTREPSP
jgi:homocysteine S-methyltransferase